jgi:hypothetical protein
LEQGSLSSSFAEISRHVAERAEGFAVDESSAQLVRGLSHPEPAQRMLALEVMCRFSEARAAQWVMGMLADPDPAVRNAAVSAAERIGTCRVKSCLIVALDDPDVSVRRACQRALEATMRCRIDLDDPESRRRIVSELTLWWKRERLAELCAEANARDVS